MTHSTPPYFELETIAVLREVPIEAWAALPPAARARTTKSMLAERILKAAANGERDRERLVDAALGSELAV